MAVKPWIAWVVLLANATAEPLVLRVVAANLTVTAQDWTSWMRHSRTADYITNQSAPEILAGFLAPHRSSRILFTNIGLWNYMQYMTAAKLQSA